MSKEQELDDLIGLLFALEREIEANRQQYAFLEQLIRDKKQEMEDDNT